MKQAVLASVLLLAGAGDLSAQNFAVTGLNPSRNFPAAPRASNVSVTFSQPPSVSSANALRVFSSQRGGRLAGTSSVSGNTLSFDPARDLQPGETVQATLTTAAQSSSGSMLATAQVFQYTVAALGGTGVFSSGTQVAVGANPLGVVLADIDNDGDLDLLAANANSNTVSVRPNNGRGQFGTGTEVAVGSGPWGVAVADVDGDGDLDFVTANSNANNFGAATASIAFNNGTGTFMVSTLQQLPISPRDPVLADLDGDGDLDLLVVSSPTRSIGVRLNDGTGVFSGTLNLTINDIPSAIVVGDIDSDGDQDIVVAPLDGFGAVSVRRNDGRGNFGAATNVRLGAGLSSICLADMDNDQDLDLVVVSYNDNSVQVLLNNGLGSFATSTSTQVGNGPRTVIPADVDGDNDLDLLVSIQGDNNVRVLLNDGTGLFTQGMAPAVEREPISIAAADIDNDGDLDLLAASTGGSISVRFNNGSGIPLANTRRRVIGTLSIAPNPTQNVARVLLPAGTRQLTMHNALGQQVRTVRTDPATTETSLDVRGLPSGIYIIRAGTTSSRLVVN